MFLGDFIDHFDVLSDPRAVPEPLSSGERSLWFLHHLAPGDGAYNIAAAARVRSPLAAGALERAFQGLVDRHAALRTAFPAMAGEPWRRVEESLDLAMLREDASGWSAERLRSRLAGEAWRPFDVERGPLLRVALLENAPGGTVLLLVIHHIVADFRSLAVLLRELPALYREAAGGVPARLPPPGPAYEEHVRQEREAVSGGHGDALLAWWRERLAGLPPLELATDRPRPAVQTRRGECHRLRLPAALGAALRARSRAHHATLFMTLTAAFQALLARHTGQEDFALGAPRAGRPDSRFASTVGYFVNPVVLRGDLSGDPTFSALLERTRSTVLAAFEHGDVPLPLLAEHLQPVRDASRTPLFQVSFVLQKETRGVEGLTAFALGEAGVEVGPDDFRLESLSIDRPPCPFDLQLHLVERQGGLILALQYNADLFDATTAARLMERFSILLGSVAESADPALSGLPLLSAAERHQLLWGWNDTAEPGTETNLFALFAAQAERTPEAPAVVFEEERLTYRELAARAEALAHHLVKLGVGPEVRVGIAAERSVELVVGLLGVLGAGGAYVPLEPDLPPQRLAMILEDAQPAVVVDRRSIAEALPQGASRPLPRAAADNAAYVLYTSGSTGRPKGVVNSHRGIVNRLLWMRDAFGLDASERFLQKTPFGFDVSIPEFFLPLLLGGRLIVARPDGHRDSAYLARLVEREGITSIHFVPSMLPFFLAEEGVAARCRSLRRVFVSGEALPWELEQRCLAALPVPLINLYGPTEAAVEVTAWACRPAARPRPVPIGRPIRNTRVHVVGRLLEAVPAGAVGELAIGGVQVARGYLGRPELTAERFTPDPFGPPGSRLYRTGDLCRHRPGGEIEYLGRLDDQVKIRGVRIEPREIEIALAAHPDVREAAVVVRRNVGAIGDAGGERSLLACVVLQEPGAAAAREAAAAAALRDFLASRLPSSMVPAFAFGAALDRLPNGKLDRRALARWTPATEPGRARLAPRNPLEELLAGLFAEVLGVERIGVEDDFFAAGGHSLAAMRLVARVRETLGAEVPLHRVFETPTVAALARGVQGSVRSAVPPLLPVPRDRPLPLSFAQQRLWFLHQMEPESPAYNMPAAVHLAGRLDTPALAAALGEVARRHEALRTRFAAAEDGPVQVIDPPAPAVLPRIDLALLSADRRLEEARRLARAEALRPFDLGGSAGGALVRTALVRLGEAEHLLLLSMHHAVSDGWSLRVLARELEALYGASPLPALPVQYADYAVWQRLWLQGERLEAELAHWRSRLAGAPAVLDLPLDRPRTAAAGDRGASRAVALPSPLLPALQALARRQGVTLFMAALAAFQALLSRVCDSEDVSVGTPVAGRSQVETQGLIGFFVNTLVLRTGLSAEPSFAALLARVRAVALDAYAHQDLPFEKLVEELRPERDLGIAPLVQVLFTLEEEPPSLRLGAAAGEIWPLAPETEKLDLSLTLRLDAGALTATFGYRTALFDGATIERLAGCFARLLAGAVDDPARRLPELPLLSAEEREQLLLEWGSADPVPPPDAALHELFEAQAARTPEAVALIAGEERWTYRRLDREAGVLARRLARLGIGPEARVGVCLRRTPLLAASLLAVLKAGGAYVPLDPEYPRERLAFLLEDAGVEVLLTQGDLAGCCGPFAGAVVLVDQTDRTDRSDDRSDQRPAALPWNLAYLIYTSGSTGRPKGVMIEHRSAVAFARWARGVFSPEELAGVLAATSVSFDLSVFELFVTLAWGGTVILAATALELPQLASAGEVTLVNTVPSAMAELVRLGGLPASVRTVNLAGEPLKKALVDAIHASSPECRVLDLYGPSEGTTYSTWAPAPRGATREPVIGRPVAGTRAVLLGRSGELVPVGVAGELCLGGEGLARGYLDRPDLTAERFVPDPFAAGEGAPGGRLYRTGDLARWLPGGDLDYLGRIDQQVKVRGFRIELGEIEAALLAHGAVREAVVLLGEAGLVAYVVAEDRAAPGAAELRSFLGERLPGFMLPAAWVFLPSLPLTANGKVDRKALAKLRPEREADAAPSGGAPRTPAEELVAGIFAEVLGLERVGVTESFFDLGGHSLLATRLVARLRGMFGIDLPVRAVFETPTVAGLAARIERPDRAERPGPPAEPVRRVPRGQPLELSFAQQRLWFLDRIEPGDASLHLPAAFDCQGRLDAAALACGLGEILRRHEALRTRFLHPGGRPFQVPLPPAELAALPLLPGIDLSALSGSALEGELARRTAAEAARPFDLARGPLLRAALLRLGPESHRLLLTVHHIAADAWSLGLLIRELGQLYAAFAAGRPSPLQELSLQYADYAVWQRGRWRDGRVDEPLRYWREHLTPPPSRLELPTDRPRESLRSRRGARLPVHLEAAAVDRMRRLGGLAGATLFMGALAVFQAVLGYHAGQDDVAVGTAVAERPDPSLEGVIGLFLNTLVLRGDLSGDPPFRTLLGRVRATVLGALAHAELPFERLVEAVQPERELSRNPLFQIFFALRSEPLPGIELPGLVLRPAEAFAGAAQFDLSLLLEESGGGLAGWIEYSPDLFDGATVERLASHCALLLAGAAAHPDLPLAELPLLSAAERAQLVVEWNDTRLEAPGSDACIHELFQARAACAPGEIAAVDARTALTFRELDERATRLAHHLVHLGVRPGDRVGVCVERSLAMLCSLLGVLKAGAAYVPLDPDYPQARLEAMLEDSGAAALIAPAGTVLRHPRTLAPAAAEAAAGGGELPRLPPGAAAYVLYTSGSTGLPKGVVVSHRNAVRFFAAMDRELAPREPGVWLAVTSICFDISVLELLWTLTRGFRVVVHGEATGGEGASVAEQIARHGVTHLQCTPSLAGLLAASPERLRGLAPLSRLLLGGEPLPGPLAERLAATVAGEVRNLYGPTETTVWSLAQRVESGEARPPIGRPLANTQVYLLDPLLRPVPLGSTGEVFLGGDGVATGYWRRPDRTAERFLPDFLGSTPGGRLYRTGDLARHRRDGRLEFLGRTDHQVKVRGVRIELGEIEVALRRHPAVAEAAAAVREDVPGDRRLVGYLVPALVPAPGAEGGIALGELRRFLAERLPEAMIPSAFVTLPALPLTRNGKVDRGALPAPDTGRLRLDGVYAAPQTPMEKMLAGVWQEVLGHERIGLDDNFFELGGSSLLLVEIEARLREALGREVPIVEMFRNPTLRGLAEALETPLHPPADTTEAFAVRLAAAAAEASPLERQRSALEELKRRRAQQKRHGR